MGDNSCDNVMSSGSSDSNSSGSTIEIKIATSDSQTYTLQVDKHVPFPALREEIATATGVLPEQQVLSIRFRSYDLLIYPTIDRLLSDYDVEDGDTVTVFVLNNPVSGSSDNSQTSGANVSGGVQEDSDAASNIWPTPGMEFVSSIRRQRAYAALASSNHDATRGVFDYDIWVGSRQPQDSSGMRRRSSANVRGNRNSSQTAGAHASGGVQEVFDAASHLPVGRRGPPTPAPSTGFWNSASQELNDLLGFASGWLSSDQTATEDSSGMRRRSSANGSGGESSQTAGARVRGGVYEDSDGPSRLPVGRGLFETPPSSWAEILPFIKDKLSEYAGGIGQLMGLLHDHLNLTDPVVWRTIEVNAMQLHDLLKNFAIVLLETSRTIMTLPMGRLPPRVSPNRGNSSHDRPRVTPNRGNYSRGQRGTDIPASSSSSRVHID